MTPSSPVLNSMVSLPLLPHTSCEENVAVMSQSLTFGFSRKSERLTFTSTDGTAGRLWENVSRRAPR